MDKKLIASLAFGAFGVAVTLLTLIADWKVSQLEARMSDRFALLREITEMKEDLAKTQDRIDDYHVKVGPIGRPVE